MIRVTLCLFCRKEIDTDGRSNWWHDGTGIEECETRFAAPDFINDPK